MVMAIMIPGKFLSLKNFTDARVSVFDIWGQRIYDNIGYTQLKAWDGTLNGSAVPEGVYYYKIFLNNSSKREYVGKITILTLVVIICLLLAVKGQAQQIAQTSQQVLFPHAI